MRSPDAGALLYAKDLVRVAAFYERLIPMERVHADADHVILRSATMELVVHAIPAQWADGFTIPEPPPPREDAAIKLTFVVSSLALARVQAPAVGGALAPAEREWSWTARGVRVCDAFDPEGNVVQLRESLSATLPQAPC